MNGINECTIAKYWQDWKDPRLVVSVLHNNDLNQVTWELRDGWLTAVVPTFPRAARTSGHAAYARLIGLQGLEVNEPDDVPAARDEAIAARRPCVIEFHTDPAVPPIPPHATWDQVLKATESVVRGDSDRLDVIKEGVKSKLQEVLPSGRND